MARSPQKLRVRFTHPDLRDMLSIYQMIDDCLAGEKKVKDAKTTYLPMPNAEDMSLANQQRYAAYLVRAVFMNVTRRTQQGLVGAVFETPTVSKVPPNLDPVVKDASGGGISLEQLSKKLAGSVLAKGRAGLFVDFPETPPTGVSRLEAETLRPNITLYQPTDITNWRVEEIGGIDILTLVVLHEKYITSDDGFEQTKKDQYRELRMVNGVCQITVWRDDAPFRSVVPTDSNGNPLNRLPFMFVGSENNDSDVDYPPMYDLATLNVAHYRNSADYEEAVYMVGQPTPWFSGLTQDWVTEVLGGTIRLGSRAAVALPVGAEAGLLQMQENTGPLEAMKQKERQMVALGARLVEQREVERTATDAMIEDKGENSVLATVARNCSAALEWSLRTCMLFVDAAAAAKADIVYTLNTVYGLADLPPDELANVVAAWQGSAISYTEMRQRLRFGGLATQDDKAAKAEIEKEQEARDQREIKKGSAIAEAGAKAKAKVAPKPGNSTGNRGRASAGRG